MKKKLGEKIYNFLGNPDKDKVLFEEIKSVDKQVDELSVCGESGNFGLIWDNTDHFNFICECGSIPNILKVRFGIVEFYPTLYFVMRCEKCGKRGRRKIYCNDKGGNPGMMKASKLQKWNE